MSSRGIPRANRAADLRTLFDCTEFDVAAGYNNLAELLQDEGKYAEAEPLYRRAIEIDKTRYTALAPDRFKGICRY
jgi:hypothetical protein